MKKAGHSTGKIAKGPMGKSGTKASGTLTGSGGKISSSGSYTGTSGGKTGTSSGKTGYSSGKLVSSGGMLGSSQKTSSFSPSTGKSYLSPSYNTSKSNKSSTSFGIIWLPTKKRNKYKDESYNSRKDDRPEKRPSMYGYMSGGDTHHHTSLFGDHKKEETNFLVPPESKASTSVAVIGAGAAAASDLHCDKSTKTEDQEDLIKNQDDDKDALSDVDKVSNDYLESNEKVISSAPDNNKEKGKDNVDSVFLRSTPAYKRPVPSVEEEESCGIKCLYYTLQCCDCVLM